MNISQNWGPELGYWNYKRPSSEFWETTISLVKSKYPNVQFLAEVYSPWNEALQRQGFDFTYDKNLYDRLGDGNLDNIRSYISQSPLDFHFHSAHFVENHDEPRAASFFGSNIRADAAAMVSMTLPGMRFYFEGQREGYKNKLDVHLRRAKAESGEPGVRQFYSNFSQILSRPIFHEGKWSYEKVYGSTESWRLMAWKWSLNGKKVLCVINYSDQSGSGRILLSDAQPVNGNDQITVTELMSGATYQRSAKDLRTNGIFVIVNYWSIQMLEYE